MKYKTYKHIIKKMLLFQLAVCCLLMFSETLSAKLAFYSFEERIDNSDIIVRGKLIKVKKRIFHKNSLLIDISRVVVGQYKSKQVEIQFGRKNIFYAKEENTNFKIGREYVLFIRKGDSGFSLVGEGQGAFLIREDEKVCLNGEYIQLNQFTDRIKEIITQGGRTPIAH